MSERIVSLGVAVILAIDPGSAESAYVIYADGTPIEFGKLRNGELLDRVEHAKRSATRWSRISHVAIEMIASYGMPVGAEVFETCVFIGRLCQAWHDVNTTTLVYRQQVKLSICKSPRANDASIRQALIDRYGGKEKAIGRKGSEGVLYGVKADIWQALAVAVTHADSITGQPSALKVDGDDAGKNRPGDASSAPLFAESAP